MKKLTLILSFSLSCLFLSAQVTNHAVFKSVDVQSNLIKLVYDLPVDGRVFEVSLESNDPNVKPKFVSGPGVGDKVKGAKDLVINWYFVQDGYTEEDITGVQLTVVAIDPKEKGMVDSGNGSKPTTGGIPPWAGLGAVATTGATLAITGLITESNASEIYDLYKENLQTNDPIFQSEGYTDREDAYDQANSKHIRAQLLMYGGGAILAAAAFIIIKRGVQNRAEAKVSLYPAFENTPSTKAPGLGLRFRF